MVFYKKICFQVKFGGLYFQTLSLLRLSNIVCRCSYMLLLVVSLVRPLFKEYGFPILTQVIKGYHWKLSLKRVTMLLKK